MLIITKNALVLSSEILVQELFGTELYREGVITNLLF